MRLPHYGGPFRAFYEAAWRPANGWIATAACAMHFVVIPASSAWMVAHGKPPLPSFDLASTIGLLSLTLGMGGLRTFEKCYGVDTPAGQIQPQVNVTVETGGGPRQ